MEKVVKTGTVKMFYGCGTIMPTRESLRYANRHSIKINCKREEIGQSQLSDCVARFEQGEMRYYRTRTIYAIVTRALAVKWFEVRADGTYSIRSA